MGIHFYIYTCYISYLCYICIQSLNTCLYAKPRVKILGNINHTCIILIQHFVTLLIPKNGLKCKKTT
ncbi:hypothetical protein HanIR_Chr02g0094701 [Helianthus annuus]|nr:hypothetical protein HanIR_Chr02g0094701 [Helianthus annuus]